MRRSARTPRSTRPNLRYEGQGSGRKTSASARPPRPQKERQCYRAPGVLKAQENDNPEGNLNESRGRAKNGLPRIRATEFLLGSDGFLRRFCVSLGNCTWFVSFVKKAFASMVGFSAASDSALRYTTIHVLPGCPAFHSADTIVKLTRWSGAEWQRGDAKRA